MTKRLLLVLGLLLAAVSIQAQKGKHEEKPKVHADFQFGSFPYSREAYQAMASDQSKFVVVGYAQGWSIDKIAKTLKLSPNDVGHAADRLEEDGLIGRRTMDDFDIHPSLPVIRDADWAKMKEPLYQAADEYAGLIQSHWDEIKRMAMSLQGSKNMPEGRVMYETVVSGIIFGGVMDAFYEAKTLMPAPPRRGKTDHFYAWLVESNPVAAGKLKRDVRESASYRIISIGPQLPEDRPMLEDLQQAKATIYEDDDARHYRAFIGVFARDKLMPYFESHRDQYIKMSRLLSSGSYTNLAEDFAWFYNVIANEAVDDLVANHLITAPEKSYTYAIRVPQQ
jgi:hypothetical protein